MQQAASTMSWDSLRWTLAAKASLDHAKNAASEAAQQVNLAKDKASGAVQQAVLKIESAAQTAHKASVDSAQRIQNSSFSVVEAAGAATEAVQQATDVTSGAARQAVQAMSAASDAAVQQMSAASDAAVQQVSAASDAAVQQATGATSGAARQAAQAVQAASDAAQKVVGTASAMALSAGSRAHKSSVETVSALYTKDPQDVRATVVCSELTGPLVIFPGKGRLEVVEAWFGHHNDLTRRRDITEEVQSCITYEEKGYSLELSTSRRFWGIDTNDAYLHVLSVTYRREVTDEPTPGELARMECAREAVKNAVVRARYELLKQIGGSPMMGSWISATPMLMGMPVPGKTVHAIYVSTAEVVSWSVEEGLRSLTYLSFLQENETAEIQVLQRPTSMNISYKIADYVRSLVHVEMPCVNALGQPMFKDSKAFCIHCYGAGGFDMGMLKSAGTFGAAVAVAAHVDEAAAAITLPIAGISGAATVSLIGATVVSPLALGGLYYLQRLNNARLGLAIVNHASVPVSVSAFELGDAKCAEWGPLRSSCTSIGGQTSGILGVGELLELNPPSSSEVYQLRYVHLEAKEDSDATDSQEGAEEASAVSSTQNPELSVVVEHGDDSLSCIFVERGGVYQITQQAGALVVNEVPENLIPAYAQAPVEKRPTSLPVMDELSSANGSCDDDYSAAVEE